VQGHDGHLQATDEQVAAVISNTLKEVDFDDFDSLNLSARNGQLKQ
jgi:hypothetical protein